MLVHTCSSENGKRLHQGNSETDIEATVGANPWIKEDWSVAGYCMDPELV